VGVLLKQYFVKNWHFCQIMHTNYSAFAAFTGAHELALWRFFSQQHQHDVALVLNAVGGQEGLAAQALALAQRNGLNAEVQTVAFFASVLGLAQGMQMQKSLTNLRQALRTFQTYKQSAQVLVSALTAHEVTVLSSFSDPRKLRVPQNWSASSWSDDRFLAVQASLFQKLGVGTRSAAEELGKASGLWRAEAYNRRYPVLVGNSAADRISRFTQYASGHQFQEREARIIRTWCFNNFNLKQTAQALQEPVDVLSDTLRQLGLRMGLRMGSKLTPLSNELRTLLGDHANVPQRAIKAELESHILLAWPQQAQQVLRQLQTVPQILAARLMPKTLKLLAYWKYTDFNLSLTALVLGVSRTGAEAGLDAACKALEISFSVRKDRFIALQKLMPETPALVSEVQAWPTLARELFLKLSENQLLKMAADSPGELEALARWVYAGFNVRSAAELFGLNENKLEKNLMLVAGNLELNGGDSKQRLVQLKRFVEQQVLEADHLYRP
jgi:hypothetical protein